MVKVIYVFGTTSSNLESFESHLFTFINLKNTLVFYHRMQPFNRFSSRLRRAGEMMCFDKDFPQDMQDVI